MIQSGKTFADFLSGYSPFRYKKSEFPPLPSNGDSETSGADLELPTLAVKPLLVAEPEGHDPRSRQKNRGKTGRLWKPLTTSPTPGARGSLEAKPSTASKSRDTEPKPAKKSRNTAPSRPSKSFDYQPEPRRKSPIPLKKSSDTETSEARKSSKNATSTSRKSPYTKASVSSVPRAITTTRSRKSPDTKSTPVKKSCGTKSTPVKKSLDTESTPVKKSSDTESTPVKKSCGTKSTPVKKSLDTESSPQKKSSDIATKASWKSGDIDSTSMKKSCDMTPSTSNSLDTESTPVKKSGVTIPCASWKSCDTKSTSAKQPCDTAPSASRESDNTSSKATQKSGGTIPTPVKDETLEGLSIQTKKCVPSARRHRSLAARTLADIENAKLKKMMRDLKGSQLEPQDMAVHSPRVRHKPIRDSPYAASLDRHSTRVAKPRQPRNMAEAVSLFKQIRGELEVHRDSRDRKAQPNYQHHNKQLLNEHTKRASILAAQKKKSSKPKAQLYDFHTLPRYLPPIEIKAPASKNDVSEDFPEKSKLRIRHTKKTSQVKANMTKKKGETNAEVLVIDHKSSSSMSNTSDNTVSGRTRLVEKVPTKNHSFPNGERNAKIKKSVAIQEAKLTKPLATAADRKSRATTGKRDPAVAPAKKVFNAPAEKTAPATSILATQKSKEAEQPAETIDTNKDDPISAESVKKSSSPVAPEPTRSTIDCPEGRERAPSVASSSSSDYDEDSFYSLPDSDTESVISDGSFNSCNANARLPSKRASSPSPSVRMSTDESEREAFDKTVSPRPKSPLSDTASYKSSSQSTSTCSASSASSRCCNRAQDRSTSAGSCKSKTNCHSSAIPVNTNIRAIFLARARQASRAETNSASQKHKPSPAKADNRASSKERARQASITSSHVRTGQVSRARSRERARQASRTERNSAIKKQTTSSDEAENKASSLERASHASKARKYSVTQRISVSPNEDKNRASSLEKDKQSSRARSHERAREATRSERFSVTSIQKPNSDKTENSASVLEMPRQSCRVSSLERDRQASRDERQSVTRKHTSCTDERTRNEIRAERYIATKKKIPSSTNTDNRASSLEGARQASRVSSLEKAGKATCKSTIERTRQAPFAETGKHNPNTEIARSHERVQQSARKNFIERAKQTSRIEKYCATKQQKPSPYKTDYKASSLERARQASGVSSLERARQASGVSSLERARQISSVRSIERARQALSVSSFKSTKQDSRIITLERARQASRVSSLESARQDSRVSSLERARQATSMSSLKSARQDSRVSSLERARQTTSVSSHKRARQATRVSSLERARQATSVNSLERARQASSVSSVERSRQATSVSSLERAREASSVSSLEKARQIFSVSSTERAKRAPRAERLSATRSRIPGPALTVKRASSVERARSSSRVKSYNSSGKCSPSPDNADNRASDLGRASHASNVAEGQFSPVKHKPSPVKADYRSSSLDASRASSLERARSSSRAESYNSSGKLSPSLDNADNRASDLGRANTASKVAEGFFSPDKHKTSLTEADYSALETAKQAYRESILERARSSSEAESYNSSGKRSPSQDNADNRASDLGRANNASKAAENCFSPAKHKTSLTEADYRALETAKQSYRESVLERARSSARAESYNSSGKRSPSQDNADNRASDLGRANNASKAAENCFSPAKHKTSLTEADYRDLETAKQVYRESILERARSSSEPKSYTSSGKRSPSQDNADNRASDLGRANNASKAAENCFSPAKHKTSLTEADYRDLETAKQVYRESVLEKARSSSRAESYNSSGKRSPSPDNADNRASNLGRANNASKAADNYYSPRKRTPSPAEAGYRESLLERAKQASRSSSLERAKQLYRAYHDTLQRKRSPSPRRPDINHASGGSSNSSLNKNSHVSKIDRIKSPNQSKDKETNPPGPKEDSPCDGSQFPPTSQSTRHKVHPAGSKESLTERPPQISSSTHDFPCRSDYVTPTPRPRSGCTSILSKKSSGSSRASSGTSRKRVTFQDDIQIGDSSSASSPRHVNHISPSPKPISHNGAPYGYARPISPAAMSTEGHVSPLLTKRPTSGGSTRTVTPVTPPTQSSCSEMKAATTDLINISASITSLAGSTEGSQSPREARPKLSPRSRRSPY